MAANRSYAPACALACRPQSVSWRRGGGVSSTHLDADGKARMVDVGEKAITQRTATAQTSVLMEAETLRLIMEGEVKKGDVLAAARLAGIMAAKRTAELIPLCHPLSLDSVAALTVYDMCKAVDRSMRIADLRVTHKAGGKSGEFSQD